MLILGLNKTTLLDYPEHVAATIFTGGCNFRCPFCHNKNLVLPQQTATYTEAEILSFLKKRVGILTGVCITGGEPTLQKDLSDFLARIKDLGYLIKLDTNGYQPDVLHNLLSKNLIDYCAMDIKNSKEVKCPFGCETETNDGSHGNHDDFRCDFRGMQYFSYHSGNRSGY